MTTMKDVAREAGVSTATVSHVINGTRQVRPETAANVRAVIARTGYIHDLGARAMRTGTSRTVGLAISAISNRYFGDVVHAIEERLSARDYSLLLGDTHDDPAVEARVIDDLLQHRPAGIILAPSADPGPAIEAVTRRGIPLVSVDRVLTGVDSVGVENTHAVRRLVQHLIEVGHESIAFVAGAPGLTTTVERTAGYEQAMAVAKLSTDGLVITGGSEREKAREAVTALFADRSPTALVVANNQMTIGALMALRGLGLSVPEDIAVAVFDDFDWGEAFTPRLTAVAQPYDEMARIALDMLFGQISGPTVRPQNIRIQPVLHHRDSCGCGHPETPL